MSDESQDLFPEPTPPPLAPPNISAIRVDGDNVVTGVHSSNMLPDDFIEVSVEIFNEASTKVGKCKYVDGALVDYTPPTATFFGMLSRRQLIQALAEDQYHVLSWRDAQEWATGQKIPQFLHDAIDHAQRGRARFYFLVSNEFFHADPHMQVLRNALEYDQDEFDTFWQFAGGL